MRRYSSLWAPAHCVLAPCLARRSRHWRARSTAVFRFALTQSQNIEGQSSTIECNFEWDAAGQLLSDGNKQHQYNPQGRKASTQAPEPSGTGSQTLNTHYLYNGHSQRVRKASPLGHTDYSYGPAELGMSHWPLGIYRSSGSTQAGTEILYLPTPQGPMPVAAEIDGQLYAIEADHLHTPRRLSNAQGQGVWQWITSGFGEVAASHAGNGFVLEGEGSGSGPNLGPSIDFALRYPGQVHDTETGLHYNHHRYYDPHLTVGYTQADPIGLDGGWNRFGYVDGNPLGFVDPEGLRATTARLPVRLQMHNREVDPHRQMRREFQWENIQEIIKKFPQGDVRCHIVCPDEDFLCKPFFIPVNSYFTASASRPSCYEVCSTGPFLDPSPPKRPALMTTIPGTRNPTRGDLIGILEILRGKK